MPKGILIPWDENLPVQEVEYNSDYSGKAGSWDGLRRQVFGDDPDLLSHGTLSVSTLRDHGFGFFYDDEGLSTQPERTNHRAGKLWAHATGHNYPQDFQVLLKGNCLAFGFDQYGEDEDVPNFVRRFFGEEGIAEA